MENQNETNMADFLGLGDSGTFETPEVPETPETQETQEEQGVQEEEETSETSETSGTSEEDETQEASKTLEQENAGEYNGDTKETSPEANSDVVAPQSEPKIDLECENELRGYKQKVELQAKQLNDKDSYIAVIKEQMTALREQLTALTKDMFEVTRAVAIDPRVLDDIVSTGDTTQLQAHNKYVQTVTQNAWAKAVSEATKAKIFTMLADKNVQGERRQEALRFLDAEYQKNPESLYGANPKYLSTMVVEHLGEWEKSKKISQGYNNPIVEEELQKLRKEIEELKKAGVKSPSVSSSSRPINKVVKPLARVSTKVVEPGASIDFTDLLNL